jgi:hypothetical protein
MNFVKKKIFFFSFLLIFLEEIQNVNFLLNTNVRNKLGQAQISR